ncbi:hypothetical protein K491DRAFT_171691 [Lophiostoma macrostomum CBS 122681]|uniref:tRNA-splicing endonuclease subunit Sen2 n=1 Tax=Lophiostoma macrostomum CBS 122681 TaxID=1314788 RepID=A0A6A6SQE5_9PLEO|nr:hypothetical protein K491DRAFT_171691 [Lophiostoma macrostomum CBS 122681]
MEHPISIQPARSEVTQENNGPDTATDAMEVDAVKPRTTRPKRPNYAQIHSKPLPIETHPLPAFIPHNPLSIVRIAIALISHSVWPPQVKRIVHKAYFSTETHSVHVTDPASIRALWEQGFFGTGSLSRTEPRWLDQEKRKRGIVAMQTSEEVTRQRRAERRQFKLERARVEREAIEQQRLLEESQTAAHQDLDKFSFQNVSVHGTSETNGLREIDPLEPSPQSVQAVLEDPPSDSKAQGLPDEVVTRIVDQEHLQLSLEEAFFLSFSLGALEVCKDQTTLPVYYLFRLYSAFSKFPIAENTERHLHNLFRYRQWHNAGINPTGDFTGSLEFSDVSSITPDNTFVYKYIVYHHFRSLGWIVRTGVKFGVDYLLYNRGPAFSHAEFGVMIVPTYSSPYWSETPERQVECKAKEHRDWWWLHRINRVQAQVHKTLMLVYVKIPPPWDFDHRNASFEINMGEVLKSYKVQEFIFSRWTPNRHRG